MKLESRLKIPIKNKVIGGCKTLICTPITPKTPSDFNLSLDDALTSNPDLIEWRADYFDTIQLPEYIYNTLSDNKDKLKDIPFIFTLRDEKEGGNFSYDHSSKLSILNKVIHSNVVDIIDIEMIQGEEYISQVSEMIKHTNIKLILSHHDFKTTPSSNDIIKKIKTALELGADIPKVAYTPTSSNDVLNLLDASLKCRDLLENPLIAISMGNLGQISRIHAGQFGSDITFASAFNTTAPGQINIFDLKKIQSYIE